MLDLGTLKIGVEVDDAKAQSKLNNLGDTTKKTEGKFSKFKGGLKKFAAGFAIVGAAAIGVGKAIKNITDKVGAYGDAIDKNSQKMGISADAYQKWDYVLERNGSSINALKTGMKTFTTQMEKGSGAFDRLGVSVKNSDGSFRSQTDVLDETMKSLAGVKDETERTALANELFGKRTAQELLPTLNSGADGIEELQKRAEELGFVMSDKTVKACADYEDAMLDVQKSTEGLRNNIFAGLMPVMADMASSLSDKIGYVSTVVHKEVEKNGAKGLLTAIGKLVAKAAQKIVKSAPQILAKMGKLGIMLLKGLASFIPKLLAKVADAMTQIADNIDSKGGNKMFKTAALLIGKLIVGIIKCIPKLVKAAAKLTLALIKALAKAGLNLVKTGAKMMADFVKGFVNSHPKLKKAFDTIGKIFKTLIKVALTPIITTFKAVKKAWDVITKLKKKDLKLYLIGGAKAAIDKAKAAWDKIKAKTKNWTLKLLGGAKDAIEKAKNAWDKVKNKTKTLTLNVKQNLSGLSAKIKKLFKLRRGINEVPYDGYQAELHKGERVLTAAEANQYDDVMRKYNNRFDGATSTQMIAAGIDYNQLANTLISALSGMNMTTAVNVDGRTIAQATAPFMKTAINTLDRRANRKLGVV